MNTEKLNKWAFKLFFIAVTTWIVFTTIEMIIYPGGTAYDPDTLGYSFWANHISDLGMITAFNNESNQVGFVFFTIGAAFMAISTIIALIAFPGLFKNEGNKKRIQMVSACGLASSACILTIIFFPEDTMYLLHILVAGIRLLTLFLYGLFGSIAFLKIKSETAFTKNYALFFLALFIIAILHMTSMAIYYFTPTSETHVLMVVLQKLRFFCELSCSFTIIYGAEKTLKG